MKRNRHSKRKREKVPDRWLEYEPINNIQCDVKIVPFKTPLHLFQFHDNLMQEHKWTPVDVMERVPNLGLVIDLTYKTPCYYNPLDFLENGVGHEKILCEGHVIPPDSIFHKFCDTVDAFLCENPDLIVGVHCTHGVNRTGYMICRYLVEKRGYTAENALKEFALMRGYPLERDNYKDHLYSVAKSLSQV